MPEEVKINTKGYRQCDDCVYREEIPGNTHTRCRFNFEKAEVEEPKGDAHGIFSES